MGVPTSRKSPSLGSLLLLTAGFFISFLSRVILSPLLLEIEMELGLNHGEAGFLFMLISIGYTISLLSSVFVTARLQHRSVLIISSFMGGLALLITAMGRVEIILFPGLVLLGFGTGLYLPSSIASITEMVDSKMWGKAIAVHEQAPNLAFFSAPLLALLLFPFLNWRGILVMLGIASLAIGILLTRLQQGKFMAEELHLDLIRELLGNPYLWVMMVLFSIGIGANYGLYTMLPLYLISGRLQEYATVNSLIPLTRVSCFFVSLISGYLADRFGPWKTLSVILIGSGITIYLLGTVSTNSLVPVLFMQPIWSTAFFPPAFSALSSLASHRRRNYLISLTNPFAFLIGTGAMPTVIGVFGQMGLFSTGIVLLGILTAAVGLFLAFLRPAKGIPTVSREII